MKVPSRARINKQAAAYYGNLLTHMPHINHSDNPLWRERFESGQLQPDEFESDIALTCVWIAQWYQTQCRYEAALMLIRLAHRTYTDATRMKSA